MRFLVLWVILLAALNAARADDALLKVGLSARDFIPPEPYDWRGAKTHALRAMNSGFRVRAKRRAPE